jgi:succinate-acetate transporter protein
MSQLPQTAPTPQPREWANATPAGLVALAVASFCFFAVLNGFVGAGALPLLACWLFGGFAVQIVVALIDLKSGNAAGGNTFLYFSAFFMLVSAAGFLMKSMLPGLDAHIDGWAWLALTLVVWLWTPAFFKSPAVLTVVVLALDVALPCITIRDIGLLANAPVNKLLGSAMILNGTFGRRILPNPAPIARERHKKQDAGKTAQA